jgi:hypothetical protein
MLIKCVIGWLNNDMNIELRDDTWEENRTEILVYGVFEEHARMR